MKQQRKKSKSSLAIWVKSAGDKFLIESHINRAKLTQFLGKNKDKWMLLELTEQQRAKSDEILGFWWGGILPYYVCHNKGIKWKDEPFFVRDLLREKLINTEEIQDAHETFLLEYRPIMVYELRTKKPTKQRGRMETMNNADMMELIEEVMDYLAENTGNTPNAEEYKKIRDSVLLKKTEQSIKQQIPYPEIKEMPSF